MDLNLYWPIKKIAILAFNAAFNAEQVMKRSDLNDMFGNIMSSADRFLT